MTTPILPEREMATPTLKDVAMLAGVSTATVSYIVNNSRPTSPEVRMRVEKAISQLGFVPNQLGRMLALRKYNTDELADLNSLTERSIKISNQFKPLNKRKEIESNIRSIPESVTISLLRTLRALQPISRNELAKRIGIDANTVSDIVNPLLQRKALLENTDYTGIEAPATLRLNTNESIVIGGYIDVRRTYIAVASLDGRIVAEEHFNTLPDPNATIDRMRLIIERLRSNFSKHKVSSVGISVPGPTDKDRKRLLYAPHLNWNDISIAESLRLNNRKSINQREVSNEIVPVIVENKANASAVYEARRRLRDHTDGAWNDFVLIRVGTGIGAGLVLGGELYRGVKHGMGFGGEFGHMTIVVGGKQCSCGNRGCWERYASAASAVNIYNGERAQSAHGSPIHFLDVVAYAEAGEPKAQRALERVGEYLGIGIGNVLSGLGISRVVISGPIVYGWRFIEDSMHEAVSRTIAGRLYNWLVEPGEPSGDGIGGAIEIAIEHYLSTLINK
jgi:predicted NBD/HSP70 family sugar kinase/plasmid maintenance system antidote protein VapI